MASFVDAPLPESKPRTKLDPVQMRCIDGLRALAVLIVIVQHYKVAFAGSHGAVALLTTPGASGVMLFFVISGLCITLSKTDRISWGQFFVRRAFRLLPALYVGMVLVLLAGHFVLHDALRASDFAGVALSLPHYFPSLLRINPPLWSLQTEIELYLLFPFMLFLFQRTSRQTFVLVSAAITLVAYGAWFISMRHFTYFPPFPAFCHVIVWNLGLLLAYDTFSDARRRSALLASACGVLLVGFACLLLRNKELTNTLAFWYLPTGVGYYLLTKWALIARPAWLRLRGMELIGKRSYSLYLVHLPIADLCTALIHSRPAAFVAAVLVTGVLVEFLYRCVELPCITLGKKLTTAQNGSSETKQAEKAYEQASV